MKKILLCLAFVLIFFSSASNVLAVYDPATTNNNIYGIHISNENDLTNAARLVNSTGGDWGYVTFVITEGERDRGRWQTVFDQMRRMHLIPIVRLATKANGESWEKPNEAEINNWIAFLNSLNWVIQNRYVIIGNEPNHAQEWGGQVDPVGYGQYLKEFSQKLKDASPDFFVLPAGMDATAKNTAGTMDEALFLRQMLANVPDAFDKVDGWSSHSYPIYQTSGRGTTTTYDWELSFLGTLGVGKKLPVFITETGWRADSFGEDEIGRNLQDAFQNIWSDKRVIAVTPFILNYPQPPFASYSWEKQDGTFYNFYKTIQNLPKVKGQPKQNESGQIIGAFAQPIIVTGSNYIGAILAKNTGESIWTPNINTIQADGNNMYFSAYSFNEIEPMKLGLIIFKAAAPKQTGVYSQSLFLTGVNGQRITNSFPIEAFLIKADQMQIDQFFAKIGGYFHLGP